MLTNETRHRRSTLVALVAYTTLHSTTARPPLTLNVSCDCHHSALHSAGLETIDWDGCGL
jgi:hypothetical protein